MEIDDKQLIKSGLTPTAYITLQAIKYEEKNILQYLNNLKILEIVIQQLEKSGYLKITGPDKSKDFILRKKALSLFSQSEVEEWYEEWRNLFPSGTNSGGYYYRGNKQEVLKNLKKFTKKYPKYTKEEIFNATRKYIARCKLRNSYMMLAHYFIEKQGVGSTLLTELENVDVVESTVKTSSINKMI